MPALVATLVCFVVGVADGDTLTARCEVPEGKVNITVRLAEIDAPEKGQPFGTRSRQHLIDICKGRAAIVSPQATDRYGRTVAHVECDGADASTEQIRAGMAWVFDRYVTDRALYAVQSAARHDGRGLWADGDAVPPWEWRSLSRAK